MMTAERYASTGPKNWQIFTTRWTSTRHCAGSPAPPESNLDDDDLHLGTYRRESGEKRRLRTPGWDAAGILEALWAKRKKWGDRAGFRGRPLSAPLKPPAAYVSYPNRAEIILGHTEVCSWINVQLGFPPGGLALIGVSPSRPRGRGTGPAQVLLAYLFPCPDHAGNPGLTAGPVIVRRLG